MQFYIIYYMYDVNIPFRILPVSSKHFLLFLVDGKYYHILKMRMWFAHYASVAFSDL